ncbi:MAG TPA: neutral zinc metallopeptidase, partial [Flavipsychrobacter sp.]|nr:neutral zinc metallopeptidase [Flavipsychrobacter sp.]
MRWIGRRESGNVEDRRGMGGGTILGGGIGTLVIGVIIYLLGGDPSQFLGDAGSNTTPQSTEERAVDSANASFVKVVLADTEDVWNEQFAKMGKDYQEARLVLFQNATQSECGQGTAATGPFYCPMDSKVYIDLSFYNELQNRFSAPGDFAMAYVVAHEVGHHVQHLLGISDKVHRLKQQVSKEEANALSVRLELQADFFAGLWAHHAQRMKNILEAGDIEEALNAAN